MQPTLNLPVLRIQVICGDQPQNVFNTEYNHRNTFYDRKQRLQVRQFIKCLKERYYNVKQDNNGYTYIKCPADGIFLISDLNDIKNPFSYICINPLLLIKRK